MTTSRQIEQRKLRLALGTVKGFHGYLDNLQHAVEICTPREQLQFTSYFLDKTIKELKYQLRVTEDQIKVQLKNLDKLFPLQEKK